MLEQAKVVMVPGSGFSPSSEPSPYFRMTFATAEASASGFYSYTGATTMAALRALPLRTIEAAYGVCWQNSQPYAVDGAVMLEMPRWVQVAAAAGTSPGYFSSQSFSAFGFLFLRSSLAPFSRSSKAQSG